MSRSIKSVILLEFFLILPLLLVDQVHQVVPEKKIT